MPAQPDASKPDPDEIDRGLREIIAGSGAESAIREPSAADRASQRARRAQGQAKRTRGAWRNTRRARKLRKPVSEPGRRPGQLRLRGRGRGPARAGRRTRRWQRARTLAIRIGVLVVFAGLLFGLHLLGFGPR
jgi:hypothetical protein